MLVTGASTGIGLELVRRLQRGHWHVVATARGTSLDRFAREGLAESSTFWIRELDVTDAAQREAVVAEIETRHGALDSLVNNAGISWRAVTEQMPAAEQEAQMRVNYLAPIELIRRVLPAMRARRRGHIINISSVGGMMAMPTMGAYSASKFALEGASESLWYELKPWGISVTLLQPGFVRSDSFHNVLLPERAQRALADPADPYHEYYRQMTRFVERLMGQSRSTAADVACRVERILRTARPPLRKGGTTDATFFYLLRRLLPRPLYHWVLYRSLPRIRQWGPRP